MNDVYNDTRTTIVYCRVSITRVNGHIRLEISLCYASIARLSCSTENEKNAVTLVRADVSLGVSSSPRSAAEAG